MTVFSYIGIFVPILAISRAVIPDDHMVYKPEERLQKVVDHTHYSPVEWREKFKKSNLSFIQFLAKEYDSKMLSMLYKKSEAFQQIKMSYNNIPLYHLAFYSQNDLGNKFWNEVKKYKSDQTEMQF